MRRVVSVLSALAIAAPAHSYLASAPRQTQLHRPACFGSRQRHAQVPQMLLEERTQASRLRSSAIDDEPAEGGTAGLAAAGALASSAVIAEAVQIGGTAVLLSLGQQWTGTDSPVEAVGAMIDYLQNLPGLEGYALFASVMIFLQVVPIAAAFVLTVSAGAIFGAVKGTATVLTCSTISATISFYISRTFARERLLEAAQESKQYRAIDAAFSEASFSTSLTLITLLRLSPVLPFACVQAARIKPARGSGGACVGGLRTLTARRLRIHARRSPLLFRSPQVGQLRLRPFARATPRLLHWHLRGLPPRCREAPARLESALREIAHSQAFAALRRTIFDRSQAHCSALCAPRHRRPGTCLLDKWARRLPSTARRATRSCWGWASRRRSARSASRATSPRTR